MKKVLALFLSVLLILAVAAPAFAAPASNLVTSADKTEVKRGESIVITVSLSDKVSAKAFVIDFVGAFDTAVFQQDTSARGMGWDSLYKEDVWDEEAQEWISPITINAKASDPVASVVFGNAAQELNGNLYKMTLKVSDNAPFGTYEIKAKTSEKYSGASGEVPFEGEIVGVTVTVTHDCVLSTDYSKDDAGHWYGCTVSGCKEPVSKLPHDFSNDCDGLCDTCGHTRSITHAPAADWTTDNTHHWKECTVNGCGEDVEKNAHTGGEATCTKKAVCSVCNVPYGEIDVKNHKNTEVRDAATESCNASGYTGDTWCKDCETMIEKGTTINPTGDHVDADGDWEADETHHFRTCACSTEFNRTLHTGGTATCKEKAICSVCGTAYGSLNAFNHTGGTYLVGQKETTCYETGYTGDIYCSDCDTMIAPGSIIEKSAHTPSSEWFTDSTRHWKECTVQGCGAELEKDGHTGGTATCKDLAACSVCAKEYGFLNTSNHAGDTYLVGQKETTCYEPGYTGDTHCSDCHAMIAPGTEIEKSAHTPSSEWFTDGTNHWKECTVQACGAALENDVHVGGEATCKKQAVCSVCNAPYGEINANNHKNTEIRDAVTESCNTPGYTGDTWCKDCETKIEDGETINPNGEHVDADGKWESDKNQHFHTCGCGTEFDQASHTGGEATCTAKAICSVCNTSYGEINANNHKNTEIRDAVTESCNAPGYTGDTWCKDCETKIQDGKDIDPTGNHVDADGKWESSETQHFHTCSCGTEFDQAAHTGGTATCKDKAVCSVCETSYGELNANNHVGETEIRDAAEAKCDKEGYTGDTYCKDCGIKIADGKKIDKIPHVVKEWTVSKEATTEATGLKTGLCTGCNKTMTVETAKLVETIKPENIEGKDVKIEIVGDSNISEDVVFKAEEILDTIVKEEKEKVDKAVEAAIEKFEEIKENVKIGAIFDFSLILRETNTNGEVIGETNLKLDGKVKVTVPVPETVLNTLENLKLLHVKDDGTVEIVPFTLADGKATFEATGFSYYTFVGTEKQVQTGDSSNLVMWSALAFVSLVTLGRIIVIKRREDYRA